MNDHRTNDDVILAELKALKELLTFQIEQMRAEIAEHQKEIDLLKLWKANSVGKLTIISAAVGVGVTLLVGWVSRHLQ